MIKEKLKSLRGSGGSIPQKTVRSGIWSLISRISTRGLSFLQIIIIARILVPKDFGLLGISLLTIEILKVFTKTGFQESIIQKKEDVKEHLNSAWTVLVLRGFALYLVLFAVAPLIAAFFNEPRAVDILRVFGLVLIFRGMRNIGVVFFRKELQFKKKFVLDLSKVLPAFVITVSLAYLLQNVWALVYGTVSGALISMVMSYFIHPHQPSLEFKIDKISEMFTFGKWIMASSIITFFLTQGDDIFVGRILGVTALGFYQLAYRISNAPATEISHTITRVLFPAYSKIQDNIKKLKVAFKKVFFVISFITFPISFGIIAIAPEFTIVILGEKWEAIILPMQILSIWGLIRALASTAGPVFKAIGKPHISTRIHIVELIFIVILIYPFSLWRGIVGISTALVISISLANLITAYYITTETKLKKKKLFKYIMIPILISGTMVAGIWISKIFIQRYDIFFLLYEIIIGAMIYLGLAFLADKKTSWKPINNIKEIWAQF
ncbi:MAG: lipopolysaccharide biosynthesis protein [Candidatus Thermoplasmatota archaeon]|nr:lipopolysaccharide biosynthesis protein [Candidatus Thermoplasmatota archaeon]